MSTWNLVSARASRRRVPLLASPAAFALPAVSSICPTSDLVFPGPGRILWSFPGGPFRNKKQTNSFLAPPKPLGFSSTIFHLWALFHNVKDLTFWSSLCYEVSCRACCDSCPVSCSTSTTLTQSVQCCLSLWFCSNSCLQMDVAWSLAFLWRA